MTLKDILLSHRLESQTTLVRGAFSAIDENLLVLRDPQLDNVQVRDLRTVSPEWDVSIKPSAWGSGIYAEEEMESL